MNRIRWGLCCQFLDSDIRFRTATHRYVSSIPPTARREYLIGIARDNAAALEAAVVRCRELGIGAFRVTSQVLPLATHPDSGYRLDELDSTGAATRAFERAGRLAAELDVRLSFHPDQFVVLNSEREPVVRSAVAELEAQTWIAERIGADTIVLHAGSAAGGIAASVARLEAGIDRLSAAARRRLALENDDRLFAPADLLPVCERAGVPLVYDVHHHRCRPDGLDVEDATALAAATWRGREPWVHVSSPRDGWGSPNPRPHAARVEPTDFPAAWRRGALTVDVEAKDKERAVLALRAAVEGAVGAPEELIA